MIDSAARATIDWDYSGKRDLSVGPGATSAERGLMWAGGLLLLGWLVVTAQLSNAVWSWWQWLIAAFIAIDIGGGAVANALNSCKRFYHSSLKNSDDRLTRLVKHHHIFAAAHVHTILAAICFAPEKLAAGIGWYVALMLSVATTLASPLYLRRPVAALLVACVIVVGTLDELTIPHFEWLAPLLFLKIVLGHCVREEPYRPG